MSLNNIKRKETQLKKKMGEIIIDKYRLNKSEDQLNIVRQLNSNTKEVFRKAKKQNQITAPYSFFKSSSPKEEFSSVSLNNSTNNTNNTNSTNSLTANTSKIKNTANLINDNNKQLYKYSNENEKLLKKMHENINKIKNKNLYLNIELKNKKKQKDLKSLQNYVKTQRVILKKINDNIKEVELVKEVEKIKEQHKYTRGLFMNKENKEKLKKFENLRKIKNLEKLKNLSRSFTEKNKKGIELYINNAVKKIKKIVNNNTGNTKQSNNSVSIGNNAVKKIKKNVNNNGRSKFHIMIQNQIKKTGKTSEERIAELKEKHYNKIKNIKPIKRFKL
jgi:hypothetical protein